MSTEQPGKGAEALRGPAAPRARPCASCPYRRSVPSGVWDAEEYDKLPAYDGEIAEQSTTAVFMCHQQDGCVCAGWLGHRDPLDLLAVRIALVTGGLDERSAKYSTDVPLFPSGRAAREHGIVEVGAPGTAAQAAIEKIERSRQH